MIPTPSPLADLRCLLWPVRCGGCGQVDVPLCPACTAALRPPPSPPPWKPVPTSVVACPPTWSALAYSGPVREAVVAWKDHGRLDLTRSLVPALTAATAQVLAVARAAGVLAGPALTGPAPTGPVLLVPVPSSRAAVRRRGEDVVATLAAAVARQLGRAGHGVVPRRAVRPVRRLSDQVGLSAAERSQNLAGALAAAPSAAVAGRWCVLLDDVVTTGSSLAETRRALEAAGARVAGAATVAATPRRAR